MSVYSRSKQDYTNISYLQLCEYSLNLHLNFGAILSQTYKDMTLYPHVYQNVHCNLLQKTSAYRNCLYISVCSLKNIVSASLCLVPIEKVTNSSFQKGIIICLSTNMKKDMKLLAFIFEHPSYA